ncbi:MAG: T9SS type A sorting domain-containing protein [Flavobacteriales bacterium]|nr:T9SS type A sorting domain-containing protein [Flavobacteriales bacterium]
MKKLNFRILLITSLLMCGFNKLKSQNNYLNIDGNNDFIQVNNNIDFSDDFTLEMRFKRDRTGIREDLLTKKDLKATVPSTNDISFILTQDDKVNIVLRETSSTQLMLTSQSTIGTTNWHHIVVVRAASSILFYVDGVLEDTGISSEDFTSTGPLLFGSNRYEGLTSTVTPRLFYDGDIDEIRIWNIERSSTEINTYLNMELSGNETGLVAYYNFNQGIPCANNINETTLIDNSINTNNGTLQSFNLTGNLSNPCESNWNGDSPNSITEQENIKLINLYPNPVSSQLLIDSELEINEIHIIDVAGKMIVSTKQNTNIINVSDLSNGIYFIQLITEEITITKKFVKH